MDTDLDIPVDRSASDMEDAVQALLSTTAISDPEFFDGILKRLAARFGDIIYAEFIRGLFHVNTEPAQAKEHWTKILTTHKDLQQRIGKTLDFRVSGLHYLVSEACVLSNPIVVEAEQFQKICHDTVTDEMTGLYNYRYFRTILARELERAQRQKEPLSLVFFDLDHFKALNDKLGHAAGDKAIRLVARAILSTARTTDIPCRYGGDELAIIAPCTPREGAILLAERIRRKVKFLTDPSRTGMEESVTLSGGVASFPEDARTAEQLLSKADEALYLAKENGRNQVEILKGDRRRYIRRPVSATAALLVETVKYRQVIIRNLSEGGFLVHDSEPVMRGDLVELEVRLDPLTSPVRCVGRVAHVAQKIAESCYAFGVSILAMSSEHKQKYQQFLSNTSVH